MADHLDNEVRLYVALVDQLHKYNSIIWQAPTALLAANAFAFNYLRLLPLFLLGLSALDAALVFAFHKMVVQQKRIIAATQTAEEELKKRYPAFVPSFQPSRVRAPDVMVLTLVALNLCILIYSIATLFCRGA